jgi:putative NADH-flavin reductase
MKIVVFGATGGTGAKLVERGLAAGDEIVAVARRPEAIVMRHDRLTIKKGDALDADSVRDAIRGMDAVISAIGPANNRKPGTVISVGIANMVNACKALGVKRFVFESGLMVGDGHGLSFVGRIGTAIFRRIHQELCDDKRKAEANLRANSDALDWVIVRPPSLDHSPARGGYRFGADLDLNVLKKLSHEDAAEFLLRAAKENAFVHLVLDVGF